MTALLASLRSALARGSACTAEHLGLYAAAAEGVSAETRDAVRGASAFVAAATQLATELPALEHLAEQTYVCLRSAARFTLCVKTRRSVSTPNDARCALIRTHLPAVSQATRARAAGGA